MKFCIAGLLIVFALSACAQPAEQSQASTPYPTYTTQPSQTSYPTYTPYNTLAPQIIVVTATLSPTPLFTPTETLIPTETPIPSETPDPPQIASARLSANKQPGIYLVGVDIAPGLWRSLGHSDDCYWQRSDRTGEIIDNFIGFAGGTIYIAPDDFSVQLNKECGSWTYLEPP